MKWHACDMPVSKSLVQNRNINFSSLVSCCCCCCFFCSLYVLYFDCDISARTGFACTHLSTCLTVYFGSMCLLCRVFLLLLLCSSVRCVLCGWNIRLNDRYVCIARTCTIAIKIYQPNRYDIVGCDCPDATRIFLYAYMFWHCQRSRS